MIGTKNKTTNTKKLFAGLSVLIVLILATALFLFTVNAEPQGPVVTNYTTETSGRNTDARMMNHSRSTITTAFFNLTGVSAKWKAYVGNVTGTLELSDAENNSIYDWTYASFEGELYATRASSALTWGSIACADMDNLNGEDSDLSLTVTDRDSVTNTFNDSTTHTDVVVAGTTLSNCYTIRLFNGTGVGTSTQFEEIVATDTSDEVYIAKLAQNELGFDSQNYDFEIIIPESETGVSNAYYFYMELT